MVTQQELKALMSYDPDTGSMVWNTGKWRRHTAGTRCREGYVQVRINRRVYPLHRLAWLWVTGEWPAHQVDHINGVRDDNRWCNLRAATHEQNQWNTATRVDNSSGFKGVSRPAGRTKWQAHINDGGRRKYLGSFDTAEAAAAAVQAARQAAHGEFARHA